MLGLAHLAVAAPDWVRATGTSALAPEVVVTATGQVAAPGVTAAGLVLLAAAAAGLLVGRVGARVVAVVVAVAGVVGTVASVGVLAEPVTAARAAATAATGVGVLVDGPEVLPVAYAAPVLGVLALVLAGLALVGARGWGHVSRRHERGAGPAAHHAAAPAVVPHGLADRDVSARDVGRDVGGPGAPVSAAASRRSAGTSGADDEDAPDTDDDVDLAELWDAQTRDRRDEPRP